MSELSVADVLDRAADLIEPEGAWNNGSGPLGCHCAWTAIVEAAGKHAGDADEQVPGVLFFAKTIGGIRSGSIWNWNDAPGRTQAEVVAKLREAASLAREGK